MSILLMTATIDSGYFGNIGTTIKDTEERRKQYEETLTKYICSSKFDKIVFAENSNQSLNEAFFNELASKYGKIIEFLEFPGDIDLMKAKGRSYGEATLILNAFQNSILISDEAVVYKVTGRVWVNNINKLINDRPESCFVAHNFKEWVLTSFFKITKDDFWDALASAPELCNDNSPNLLWCIEHVYFELLKKVSAHIKGFHLYPDMRGIISGTGTPYTKTKRQLFVRNIVTFLKINKYNPKKQFYYPLIRWLAKISAAGSRRLH